MGLDVYVGTLTRYYTGQWETVVQQYCREQGVSYQVDRQDQPTDAVSDPAIVESAVAAWRQGLGAALAPHGVADLTWIEGLEPPYFTDKPAWDCYAALLLWAAHDEYPGHPLPSVAPDEWTGDAAFQASAAAGSRSRYSHLVADVQLWLPAKFDFTFVTEDLAGHRVGVGSVSTLRTQLQELNQRTWRASEQDLLVWRKEGAEHGAPLETSARFGFAVFAELTVAADRAQLPMKLDY